MSPPLLSSPSSLGGREEKRGRGRERRERRREKREKRERERESHRCPLLGRVRLRVVFNLKWGNAGNV